MKFLSLLMTLCIFTLPSCAVIEHDITNKRDFTAGELEKLEATYYQEFTSNEKITNSNTKALRQTQCVMRSLTREVTGAYSSLRTEWNVDLLRTCSMNISLIGNGTLVLSNCVPGLVSNQHQLAYLVAHSLAHLLLEHDNIRLSQLFDGRADDDDFNLKEYLRTKEGYNGVTQALGLIDVEGKFKPYTKEEEMQADFIALTIMAKAGFNPSEALVLWQNMLTNDELRAKEYVQMHPHTKEDLVLMSEKMTDFAKSIEYARKYGRKPTCQ